VHRACTEAVSRAVLPIPVPFKLGAYICCDPDRPIQWRATRCSTMSAKWMRFLGLEFGVCWDCLQRYRLLAGHRVTFSYEPQIMKTKAADLLIAIGLLQLVSDAVSTLALASPIGDDCRKEICNSAVSGCMQSDQTLNPLAWTEAEKKIYCAAFFNGCMTREITPDLPWYSPEMDARFLKCPA
jgi:hypothetical protein